MDSKLNYKRIVIKIGSSSLTHAETGRLNLAKMEHLVRQLSDLHNQGMDVCLVSSGAIAVGRAAMGVKERPSETLNLMERRRMGRIHFIRTEHTSRCDHTDRRFLLLHHTHLNR